MPSQRDRPSYFGTTHDPFFAKFKATSSKLGQKLKQLTRELKSSNNLMYSTIYSKTQTKD